LNPWFVSKEEPLEEGMNANASLISLIFFAASASVSQAEELPMPLAGAAEAVEVLVLSTNLADAGIGEWGFSALVRVDGTCVLFDTGRYPETVLENADRLNVDLGCVRDVVLSHFHGDHTGGAAPIVRNILGKSPDAQITVHVAEHFFDRRRLRGEESTSHAEAGDALRSLGVEIIEHAGPAEIRPGVWITGPITRMHDERNWGTAFTRLVEGEWIEDTVPDDQALTVVTDRGHIVLVGCGHAGAVNTLEAVQSEIAEVPIHALIGGLHLFAANEEVLAWTAAGMARMGVENLMGGHCTGIESLYRLREGTGLMRETAVVTAVGSSFQLGSGIHPRNLAR
jgi:7,8-dihydropterin-6-yl-methyl-4-(beta-D-ribofuranosyl)aminobenzene 5'-phosphate synthase